MQPDPAILVPFPADRSGRSYLCGLLGSGIRKSRSPDIHETEAAALGLRLVYRTIDFESFGAGGEALPNVLQAAERFGFDGLNVTHPYKQLILPFLDEMSDMARGVGAVNTVVFRGGKRIGYNTDASGFLGCFHDGLPGAVVERIVQLGAGGAGSATSHALLLRGGAGNIGIYDVDAARSGKLVENLVRHFGEGRAYVIPDLSALAEAVKKADGLVQTSPVGMSSHPGLPMPTALLRPEMWVADIIYFPAETELLHAARTLGCRTVGGGAMVVLQAADAFKHFTGVKPDIARMLRHFNEEN
ncbi:shikimate dehydrogenase [Telmatospirillum siberiense]|uniref:Shikimate dehydrogenase n=1 Tax=Telmatospirillum siberiense TaxID=382514 RepID=A0A2N3PUQ6_9PROT|nr:shikimate dehydrogenase [Telmatospirillum siberiense]PKU24135.1 shikimate dehydrogenase [Telmatospirillum siberiense]